jgi:CheY-like chemotaxis protein
MTAPRLLVVDDSPDIGFIVRRLGRRAGHEVVECASVGAVLEYLRSATDAVPRTQPDTLPYSVRLPDLVLLDVNLPDAPGPELCRWLRATPGLAALPVAVFGHWDRPGDVAAGLAAGADFVICKDLLTRPEAWWDRLREVLAWPHGQMARRLLSCSEITRLPALPEVVTQSLNSLVRQALPLPVRPLVLPVLAERALQTVAWWESGTGDGPAGPPRPRPLTDVPDGWLQPTGLDLAPGRLARLDRPGAVVVFAVALVEQLACVVGTAAAPRSALPGLEEMLGP